MLCPANPVLSITFQPTTKYMHRKSVSFAPSLCDAEPPLTRSASRVSRRTPAIDDLFRSIGGGPDTLHFPKIYCFTISWVYEQVTLDRETIFRNKVVDTIINLLAIGNVDELGACKPYFSSPSYCYLLPVHAE